MLNRQKIISFKIKNKIIWGLKKIQNQIIKKKYIFDYKDEDQSKFDFNLLIWEITSWSTDLKKIQIKKSIKKLLQIIWIKYLPSQRFCNPMICEKKNCN